MTRERNHVFKGRGEKEGRNKGGLCFEDLRERNQPSKRKAPEKGVETLESIPSKRRPVKKKKRQQLTREGEEPRKKMGVSKARTLRGAVKCHLVKNGPKKMTGGPTTKKGKNKGKNQRGRVGISRWRLWDLNRLSSSLLKIQQQETNWKKT